MPVPLEATLQPSPLMRPLPRLQCGTQGQNAIAPRPHQPPSLKHTQVTLVREYAQGPHSVMFSLPCGAFDPEKHDTIEDCARAELSEEVRAPGHGRPACLLARVSRTSLQHRLWEGATHLPRPGPCT